MTHEAILQDIEKQLNDTKGALMRLKEVDKHLQEMKRKIEFHAMFINDAVKRNDSTNLSRIKQEYNIINSYNEIEKHLLGSNIGPGILAILNPSKDTVDKKTFQNSQAKFNFNLSKQHFYDEFTQTTVKDSQVFRLYKSFFSQFYSSSDPIEIPYSTFTDYLDFAIHKHNLIWARFYNSSKLEDLPEIFYETIIRSDLTTITFTFKKTGNLNSTGDVFLHKIVYSTLFDKKAKNFFQKEHNNSNIHLKYARQGQIDKDIENLLKVIQKNLNKVCLPCTYPSLYIYQFFSNQVMEKIERFWKSGMIPANDKKKITDILESIVKTNPENLHTCMQQVCGVCKRMMKCDTHTQKLLPSMWIEFDSKTSQKTILHHPCFKIHKFGKEIDEPKILVSFEVTDSKEDDEMDVNKFFN